MANTLKGLKMHRVTRDPMNGMQILSNVKNKRKRVNAVLRAIELQPRITTMEQNSNSKPSNYLTDSPVLLVLQTGSFL